MARRGRPSGFTINPDSFQALIGDESQARIAALADLSPSFLSEMLAGNKGATDEVAERLTDAVATVVGRKVGPGALFPERCTFKVEYREFTVPPRVAEAVA